MRESAYNAPPLVVLAGSDPQPVELTEAGRGLNPISGYKGVILLADGQPLVRCLLERLAVSNRFSELYIAGPAQIYSRLTQGASLIECDGRIESNLRAAFHAVRENHPYGPIAFITCDVLPDARVIGEAMDRYAEAAPCDVFCPLVELPNLVGALGASAWKPRYRVRAEARAAPQDILPGHLIIVDPDALRLNFVLQLVRLSYRTRNRPLGERHWTLRRGLLGHALWEDLRLLLTLRVPELTAALIADGAAVAMGLRSGNMTTEQIARAVRQVVVSYHHRRRYPQRRVHLPILTEALSLACDIDTEEEALEAGFRLGSMPCPSSNAPPAESGGRKQGMLTPRRR